MGIPIHTPQGWRPPPVLSPDCGPNALSGSTSNPGCAGVAGGNYSNSGLGPGVYGEALVEPVGSVDIVRGADPPVAPGVFGTSLRGIGVYGSCVQGVGVYGVSEHGDAGYFANSSGGRGLYAQGAPAAYFAGDLQITGDVVLLNSPPSGDIAEDFDLAEGDMNAEPGTVLVIDDSGKLCASTCEYDSRVAGVVSGAGDLRPAVVLQRIQSQQRRAPVALLGKVVCKVDATADRIVPGDLLTTSPTPGHAMKASDISRALGAIIGKALAGFEGGLGLIPIMVSLR